MSLLTVHKNVTFEIKGKLQNFIQANSSDEVDYLNYNCVNDAYQTFVSKFLQKVDSIVPIRTIRVLHPIQNRDKYYKKFKQSGKETDKDNLTNARFLL